MKLTIGQRFDTEYEAGCIVQSLPNPFGDFDATDSEGVVCTFHVDMVRNPPCVWCGEPTKNGLRWCSTKCQREEDGATASAEDEK